MIKAEAGTHMASIIPTVFAHNKKQFTQRLKKLLPVADHLQVDFMDGKFVPAKSVQAGWLPDLRNLGTAFEAHLMVARPDRWIKRIKDRGFTKLIFHIEVVDEQQGKRLVDRIRATGMIPMIAINPGTPIARLDPFVTGKESVREYLFMGIRPGKEHQKLLPNVYDKIRKFKKRHPNARVQIDGGVNHLTARRLSQAGADRLNTGSYVANALDPAAAKRALERDVTKGRKERMMVRR